MTPDEMRALLDAATPGPWEARGSSIVLPAPDDPADRIAIAVGGNARLIVAAVNALPLLLDLWRAADALYRPSEDVRFTEIPAMDEAVSAALRALDEMQR